MCPVCLPITDLQFEMVDALWQGEEAVGGEHQSLEVVQTTHALRDALELVASSNKVLQVRQLSYGRWNALKIQIVV